MAGGSWLSQSKIRPGCYINFEAVPKSNMAVGDRGIVAMAIPLSWGKQGGVTEVLSADLVDGASRRLVGFSAEDEDSKLLIGALRYCYKAVIYRLDEGGTKAGAKVGKLVANAKYNGTFGNSIKISVAKNSAEMYEVSTYVKGALADLQTVSEISELKPNAYVEFSKDSEAEGNSDFSETAGVDLTGGTNGTVEGISYPAIFRALKIAKWQVFACFSTEAAVKGQVYDFIRNLRENEGRYVQAVISNYPYADYEGIINSVNGAVIDGVEYQPNEFVSVVAGMTAGANFNESNTARVVDGASSIIGELDDTEIKTALKEGKFLLSTTSKGKVKVEQDINSLHTYTKKRSYSYSKNRVIRVLDDLGTQAKEVWEENYMGKVDNDANGRGLFKADLINYGNELTRLNAIQEFDGTEDISVERGENIDSVVAGWHVKPIDAMEKLYLTVVI